MNSLTTKILVFALPAIGALAIQRNEIQQWFRGPADDVQFVTFQAPGPQPAVESQDVTPQSVANVVQVTKLDSENGIVRLASIRHEFDDVLDIMSLEEVDVQDAVLSQQEIAVSDVANDVKGIVRLSDVKSATPHDDLVFVSEEDVAAHGYSSLKFAESTFVDSVTSVGRTRDVTLPGDVQARHKPTQTTPLTTTYEQPTTTQPATTYEQPAPERPTSSPVGIVTNTYSAASDSDSSLTSPPTTNPAASTTAASDPSSIAPQSVLVDHDVASQPTPRRDVTPESVAVEPASSDVELDWQPVDIRSLEVDAQQVAEKLPTAKRATRDDKLLARKAVQLGFELVQRRANYSARARFIEALRVVTRSLDEQTYSTKHAVALGNALKAYEEAGDFFPSSGRPDEAVNLHVIIGGHDTPVLQNADSDQLSPRVCVREYLAYAEQEFVAALGQEEYASQALYGLGRLEAAIETTSSSANNVRAHRSLALYQSALEIDRNNYAAANELGVLLARYGKYDNAVSALQHCVRLSPQPTAWLNLSNIYQRMGRTEDARMAELNAGRTMAAAPGTPFVATQPRVEWVENDEFARLASLDTNLQPQNASVDTSPAAAATSEPPKSTPTKSRLRFFGR